MIDFEQHTECFMVLPAFDISITECPNPDCREQHVRLTFGWAIWSIHFIFP